MSQAESTGPLLQRHSLNHLDDSSFNLAVYEFSHGPLSYDTDRLEHYFLILLKGPSYLIRFLVI